MEQLHCLSELTREKLAELKSDMDDWVSIMGDLGGLLCKFLILDALLVYLPLLIYRTATGRRLQDAVRRQVDSGLTQLEYHVEQNTSPAPKSEAEDGDSNVGGGDMLVSSHVTQQPEKAAGYSSSYGTYPEPARQLDSFTGTNPYQSTSTAQGSNEYGQSAQYSYTTQNTDYTGPVTSPYPLGYQSSFGNNTMQSSYNRQQQTPENAAANGMYQQIGGTYPNQQPSYPDSNSWYQYTQTIPTGIPPQDYQPANALLQLGGRTDSNVNDDLSQMPGGMETSGMSGGAGHTWPLGLFDPSSSGS